MDHDGFYPSVPQQGAQLDPAMLQMMMQLLVAPPPEDDGLPPEYDIDTQRDYRNAYQDTISSVADLMNAYIAGPSAYGPEAFDPIVEREVIETPTMDALRGRVGSGGFEGFLAEAGLAGMPPDVAVAALRDAIERPEVGNMDPETSAAIRASLPTYTPDGPRGRLSEPVIDWQAITRRAQTLLDPAYAEWTATQGAIDAGVPGIEQGDDRRYYRVSTTDSPAVEWAKDKGLPDPRSQYDMSWAMQNLPGAAEGVARTADSNALMQRLIGDRQQLGEQMQMARRNEALPAMSRYVTRQNTPERTETVTGQLDPNVMSQYPGLANILGESPASYSGQVTTPAGMRTVSADDPRKLPQGAPIARVRRQAQPEFTHAQGPGGHGMGGAGPNLEALVRQRNRSFDNVEAEKARMRDLYTSDPMQNPAMVAAMIENARRNGRTPSSDAVQQRLAPLMSVGALGPQNPWG